MDSPGNKAICMHEGFALHYSTGHGQRLLVARRIEPKSLLKLNSDYEETDI